MAAVNRLVYKKTLDRELKRGTSLEKAMKVADKSGVKAARGIRSLSKKKKPSLMKRIKGLFRKKKDSKRKQIKYPAPGRKM